VAVHVGSLIAVVTYFREEVVNMTRAWFADLPKVVQRAPISKDAWLAWAVIIGTIPVGLAGLLFKSFIEENFRSAFVIAMTTITFGIFLWVADRRKNKTRTEYDMGIKTVLMIGLAQAVALIPGTSRSGITMTAGLLLGLTREAAARFSFLLSIPVIVLAGGLLTIELIQQSAPVAWADMALGLGISMLSAYACIHWFLKLIEKLGFLPFIIYRLLLGAVILLIIGI
jgi:undecaprenyl-diphosphatase